MNTSAPVYSGMVQRRLRVAQKHEVLAKGIAQASDGLCCVFAEGEGQLVFAAAEDRVADLDELVEDLCHELQGTLLP